MNKYHGFKIGDRVHVKNTDLAYDEQGEIAPNMEGTIKDFPPKVRIVRGKNYDTLPHFAYVIFDRIADKIHNTRFRAGIDICNLEKIKPVKVLFRLFQGEVIAIFPEIPGTNDISTCLSYVHNGQHGSCSPYGIVNNSKLATEQEYANLLHELTGIGYDVQVIRGLHPVYQINRRKELL